MRLLMYSTKMNRLSQHQTFYKSPYLIIGGLFYSRTISGISQCHCGWLRNPAPVGRWLFIPLNIPWNLHWFINIYCKIKTFWDRKNLISTENIFLTWKWCRIMACPSTACLPPIFVVRRSWLPSVGCPGRIAGSQDNIRNALDIACVFYNWIHIYIYSVYIYMYIYKYTVYIYTLYKYVCMCHTCYIYIYSYMMLYVHSSWIQA